MNVLLLVGGSSLVAVTVLLLLLVRVRAVDARERRAEGHRTVAGVVTAVDVAGRQGAYRVATVAYRDGATEHHAVLRVSVGEAAERGLAPGTAVPVAFHPERPADGVADPGGPVRPTIGDLVATAAVLELLVVASAAAV